MGPNPGAWVETQLVGHERCCEGVQWGGPRDRQGPKRPRRRLKGRQRQRRRQEFEPRPKERRGQSQGQSENRSAGKSQGEGDRLGPAAPRLGRLLCSPGRVPSQLGPAVFGLESIQSSVLARTEAHLFIYLAGVSCFCCFVCGGRQRRERPRRTGSGRLET